MPKKKIQETLEKEIYPYLASDIRSSLKEIPNSFWDQAEEIRLRMDKPLMLVLGHGDYLTSTLVNREDIHKTLQLMSRSSLYALEEELRNGYLTLPGGHRVGVVGQGVVEHGKIKTLKNISGFNLRISREVKGAADQLIPYLLNPEEHGVYHTMIISPPQGGKTTLLRDIARQLSDGRKDLNLPGMKVGIVDERSEIAACFRGVPQRDVGLRTDVLDACPKAEGMMMLIRSMSPQVIITDEVGRLADVEAIEEGVNSGVKIIASVHGSKMEDLEKRPSLLRLLENGIFERFVFLERKNGTGKIEKILDEKGKLIIQEKSLSLVQKGGENCG